MFEEAEHLELAEHPLGGDEALEDVGQFLERHPPAVSGVRHRPVTDTTSVLADGTEAESG